MMDTRIYTRTDKSFGVYSPRRLPRNQGGYIAPTNSLSAPLPIHRNYLAIVVPHTVTERWTYTVPARRRAVLQSAYANIVRFLAAPGDVLVSAGIGIYRQRIPAAAQLLVAQFTNRAIGAQHSVLHPGGVELYPEDRIACETFDLNAGGSVNYAITVLLTEYDAAER